MYDSTTTVAVGLDVHARSIRLAAVRADELVEERTLPYDEEQVERLLRRWPSVRCCYEAGPTRLGFFPLPGGGGVACGGAAGADLRAIVRAGGGARSRASTRGRAPRPDARPAPPLEVLFAP